MSDLLAGLAQWSVDIVYSSGYIGIAVLIGLINLHVLPIPTQLILCLAGFLVGQGQFAFALVLLSSTVGAVAAEDVHALYAGGDGDKCAYSRKEVADEDGLAAVYLEHLARPFEVRHEDKLESFEAFDDAAQALLADPEP